MQISLLATLPLVIPQSHANELLPQNAFAIQTKTSEYKISLDRFEFWDNIVRELSANAPFGEGNRIIAYLYNAQKAFADASYSLTGSYSGSFDPISLAIIHLFYPDYKIDSSKINDDPFSKELSAPLEKKFTARFKEEQAHLRASTVPNHPELWHGKEPYMGITIPSMKPWAIKNIEMYKANPPPLPSNKIFWQNQLAQVKQAMKLATESQKESILFWAGMSGPNSGDWEFIAQTYVSNNKIPLNKVLELRAKLATTICDAMIATFYSKYLYCIKRPNMLDPNLKPFIPTPNFPSYPSAHSVICSAVGKVLSVYFPENKQEWEKLAEEGGKSRIWAGIHYPIDHTAGKELGNKVAQTILNYEGPL